MNTKKYVLGFVFSEDKSKVALINKLRPEWQKDYLNGIGGKVEESDINEFSAMSREFEEETGVLIEGHNWHKFATMTFNNDVLGGVAVVYCFRYFSDLVFNCKTVEEEIIELIDVSTFRERKIIKNLNVLIPMALDTDFHYSELLLL